MEIIREANQTLIFKISGEMNLENHSNIKNKILESLTSDFKKIYLDLSGVTYIDSSGLGLLISIEKYVKTNEKTMSLKAVPADIKRVLDLSGLENFFHFVD
jgi:anti-anti-sigma factor